MRKQLTVSVSKNFRLTPDYFSDVQHVACFNSGDDQHGTDLLAADSLQEIKAGDTRGALDQLRAGLQSQTDWWFGFLTYDLKNEIENLTSKNHDGLQFPALHFFRPRWVFRLDVDRLTLYHLEKNDEEARRVLENVVAFEPARRETAVNSFDMQPRTAREQYLEKVEALLNHIRLGDIYEANFCQEFYAEAVSFDPIAGYAQLRKLTQAPFGSFYRCDAHYLCCGSPERFLRKQGLNLMSQPIKGTAPRGRTPEEDEKLKQDLAENQKERSENVMIVDLVRNDLSRIASRASVRVSELFGVYSFQTVHQLISTVEAKVRREVDFVDVIRATFPMGSMTGAPKIRAMQLIEQYEDTKRGLYSGAVGYITPEGDFDFNVIIRSLLYNADRRYLSAMAGGAITAGSDPQMEYEESLLKAEAMMNALKSEADATAV